MLRDEYETVIGLEVHAELSTKTKIFCSCPTSFGAAPNTHVCPICMAMPGTLPVLNERVVEYAVKAGLATECTISQDSKNDRKNYFYPDLPKAYQISQYDKPLCEHGKIEIEPHTGKKTIGITRIHIEEDAGKLKSILEYIEVSDCKMQEGSLRADVNVSVRKKGESKLGTRTEMKNMNSFRSITRAIEYEIDRQIDVIENGGKVEQETLRWDEVSVKTFSMRDKEDAQDYRYFPDPDLVAIKLSDEYIENIRKTLPELPESRKQRYLTEYGLSEKDANIITSSKYLSDLFEEASKICKNPKAVNNWIISDISRILNETEMDPVEIPFDSKQLAKLVMLIDKGTISSSIAKKVLVEMFEHPRDPEDIIDEKGWVQISDEGAIREVVSKVLANNPQSVADYKAGKEKALGFLVGQAMKETRGKANPQMLNKMFKEELK